jgi:hypothetical protein
VSPLIAHYSEAKTTLAKVFGATEDLLHLHAGLIIFFAAALFFKRRMRSRVPCALVYIFAIANEMIDAMSPGSAVSALEPAVDILNTVLWPTLLFFLARRQGRAGHPDRTA